MRPKLQVTLRALVNIIQHPSMKGYYILYNSHHYAASSGMVPSYP